MNTFTQAVKNFWNEEEGVTAIEYGLIAALIALLIIGGATVVGQQLQIVFNNIGTALTTAVAAS